MPALEAHGGCGALSLKHSPCPDLFTAGAVKRRRPVSQRKVSMSREQVVRVEVSRKCPGRV